MCSLDSLLPGDKAVISSISGKTNEEAHLIRQAESFDDLVKNQVVLDFKENVLT